MDTMPARREKTGHLTAKINGHLLQGGQGPVQREQGGNETEYEGELADFLHPAGCFPSGEEKSDQENRKDGHIQETAIDKQFEHKAMSFVG